MTNPRSRRGLTLAEVVILGAIALLLVAIAVPAILQARAGARTQQCLKNLKQIAQGLENYGEISGKAFPYGTVVNDRLPPERRWSWYVGAWSMVGDGQTGLLVDFSKAWDAEGNRPVRGTVSAEAPDEAKELVVVPHFRCPANPVYRNPERRDAASYVGAAGVGPDVASVPEDAPRVGIWGYDRQTIWSEIVDGREFTILLIETGLDCGPWMAGGPSTVRGLLPDETPYLGVGRQFGGLHPDGVNAAMADGSVRTISAEVDPEVFALQIGIHDAPRTSDAPR